MYVFVNQLHTQNIIILYNIELFVQLFGTECANILMVLNNTLSPFWSPSDILCHVAQKFSTFYILLTWKLLFSVEANFNLVIA